MFLKSVKHILLLSGSPKPSVIWYRQQNFYEEMIDDSFETVFLENPVNGTVSMVVNEFVIRRLTRDDYMARYICRVSSKFHYRPLTQSITIDMNCMLYKVLWNPLIRSNIDKLQ